MVRKLKVVLDCGNGTTSLYAENIYKQFPNLDITMICDESDATFPNHHPDPSVEKNLEMLKAKIKETGADYIVTVCPFCEFHLHQVTGLPVKNIASLMLEGYLKKDF